LAQIAEILNDRRHTFAYNHVSSAREAGATPEGSEAQEKAVKEEGLSDALAGVAGQMAEVGGYLWTKGWAERNAGNLSADVTDLVSPEKPDPTRHPKLPATIPEPRLAGRSFLITATGSRFREIADHASRCLLLLRIDEALDGYRVLWGGNGRERPTSEFPAHLEVHGFLQTSESTYRAVVHTHPTHLIALTHLETFDREEQLSQLLSAMHPEVKAVLADGVGFAGYRCPGSQELADATARVLRDHRLCVWEKHGCVALGRDVVEAFDLIDTANKAAEIYLLCRATGQEPQGLSAEQLDELERTFGGSRGGE
jgi:rhamnulose-1-phosphate aldolase